MPGRKTQRDTIIGLLEEGPVCGTTLLEAYIPRYAAVIHTLRGEGRTIITRECTRPHHRHDTKQIEYVMSDASPKLGSNNDDVAAVPSGPSSTGPGDNGTLFDTEPTAGSKPWLET